MSDFDEAFDRASAASGYRCTGLAELIAFRSHVERRNAWIDIVETYECNGDLEIPRIELGLYGDRGVEGLPSDLAGRGLDLIVAAALNETKPLIFQVWLGRID